MAKLKPCRKCGSANIKISDCGYSSFNVGTVKCKKCGHNIVLSPCSCFPNNELIAAWNKDKPTTEEQLKDAKATIRKLRKEITKLSVHDLSDKLIEGEIQVQQRE